ncbi:MAG: hypothetical protein AAF607_05465 [Pseudomonadota bacterium]
MSENATDQGAARAKALIRDPGRSKPNFIADATPDKLIAVTMRLAMEISVLRDQLDTQRALLEKHGLLSQSDIDAFEPSDAQSAARKAAKQDLVAAIISDLS